MAVVSGRQADGSHMRSCQGCQKDLPQREVKRFFRLKGTQDRIASIL